MRRPSEEATYKRNRTYSKVPGYIGTFASLDEAQSGAATATWWPVSSRPFRVTGLGAGNPTQLAGSMGTQSGAAPVVPTVLAAVEAEAPADEVAKVASASGAAAKLVVASLDVAGSSDASELQDGFRREAGQRCAAQGSFRARGTAQLAVVSLGAAQAASPAAVSHA